MPRFKPREFCIQYLDVACGLTLWQNDCLRPTVNDFLEILSAAGAVDWIDADSELALPEEVGIGKHIAHKDARFEFSLRRNRVLEIEYEGIRTEQIGINHEVRLIARNIEAGTPRELLG